VKRYRTTLKTPPDAQPSAQPLFLGKEKLGVPQNENVSLVLESDGTQVEDGEYFKTLGNNTILLLLRHGERWCPTGVDIIRAGG